MFLQVWEEESSPCNKTVGGYLVHTRLSLASEFNLTMDDDEFFELSLSLSEDDMLSCWVVEQRLENDLGEDIEEAVVGLFAPAENANTSGDRLLNKENSRK